MPKLKTSVLVSFLLLSSAMINGRYRYLDVGDIHLGGADYAISPGFVLTVLLVPYLFVKYFQNKLSKPNISTGLLLCLLVLPIVLSCFSAENLQYSLLEAVRAVVFFFMILVFLEGLKYGSLNWIYRALAIILLAQVLGIGAHLLGISDFMVREGDFSKEAVTRLTGLQGHPNILASVCNVIASFMLAALYYAEAKHRKYFLVLFLTASVLVLSTLSRAGLLVLVVSSVYVIFFARRESGIGKKGIFVVLGVFLGILFFLVFGEGILYRVLEGSDSSVNARVYLNTAAFKAFLASPIIGHGANNFIYFSSFFDDSIITDIWNAPVHNIYLMIASETGVIGLVCFVYIVGNCLKNFRANALINDISVRKLSIGAEAALMGLLIGGMFGFFLRHDVAQPLLAFIFATAFFRFRRA